MLEPAALSDADGATRWLDEEEQGAWRAYLRGTSQVMGCLEADIEQFGLSLSEFEILAMLSESPEGYLRMAVLAELVVQSRSRLTHTAGRLEKRGWVTRRPAPNDKRGVELHLTDEGMETLERVAPIHVESVRRTLMDALGRDDFLALGALMSRVRQALVDPS